ncbi:hypothetical protein P175DRAFT_0532163 [Aspergillus ochraceoroseus IBT 24754]|uniref:Uncharacterized protein n=1 Tax=Aspergillus ochraceoroseus IBT 24754 TaxID=1392256 RepID=A0A2T5LX10_9EURO|nr:uncharacterized protein P175DRAFT_0532163 [Aspergillus ochraceoroseus IBT 24754]PTU20810.1 hypothetical protein P175DRAFT_0532163 [Aspergillus ochraceoroseus IBT 24754]
MAQTRIRGRHQEDHNKQPETDVATCRFIGIVVVISVFLTRDGSSRITQLGNRSHEPSNEGHFEGILRAFRGLEENPKEHHDGFFLNARRISFCIVHAPLSPGDHDQEIPQVSINNESSFELSGDVIWGTINYIASLTWTSTNFN